MKKSCCKSCKKAKSKTREWTSTQVKYRQFFQEKRKQGLSAKEVGAAWKLKKQKK